MAKPKSDKTVKSINFDNFILADLEAYCKKANIHISTFVNDLVRKVVMDQEGFAREMSKFHCAEMNRWQKELEFLRGEK